MLSVFPEPPTEATLNDARRELISQRDSLTALTDKIDGAELALAQIVAESKCTISEMQRERLALEEQLTHTLAYTAPIRRLPQELLRHIFMFNFDDYSCCAWVLAAVCSLWRRLALSMPKIWSKIRLVTTQNSSADTIRLWLERSGDTASLDIEIFLRVNSTTTETTSRARSVSPSSWAYPLPPPGGSAPATYVIAQPTHTPLPLTGLPPSHTPIIIPPSPSHHDPWGSPPHPSSSQQQLGPQSKASMHWGHIAIFYLVGQMHRWERFVFRFDKQFTSMAALKSIAGDAPLLDEFEISCAEPAFYNTEWPWLPSANASTSVLLPKLTSLTLQYTPFKWSSPVFKTGLRSLTLRALPSNHLPLDRILHLLANNPELENLSLHFAAVLPAILPLSPVTLPELRDLSLGGHFLMSQLLDSLILPAVDGMTLDIESRDPIEDTISNLLTRSNNPPLAHLSVAYGTSTSSSFYYGSGGVVISWTFLADLNSLESLHVGGTPFEPLLSALGAPDEDQTSWLCPNLTSVGMKNCHSHSEGVSKLVQMVEARNPDASTSAVTVNGVAPTKLKQLELHDCASLGQDVVKWLKARIEEVVCTEPPYDRSGYFIRSSVV